MSTSKLKGRAHAEDVQDGALSVSPKSPPSSFCLPQRMHMHTSPTRSLGKLLASKSFFVETNKHLTIPFNTCSTMY